jgi:hypothetical protein
VLCESDAGVLRIFLSMDCFFVRNTVFRCSVAWKDLTMISVGVFLVFRGFGARIWKWRVLFLRRLGTRVWKWRIDRKISRKLESQHMHSR